MARNPGREADVYHGRKARLNSGIPLSEWSGSGATDRLHETISEFTEATETQTGQMIKLTRWLLVLTALLFVGLVVQIVLAVV